MSSPRVAFSFDAVLTVDERIVGPVLLPEEKPSDFVVEFNATYGRIGMKIESVSDLRDVNVETCETDCPKKENPADSLESPGNSYCQP